MTTFATSIQQAPPPGSSFYLEDVSWDYYEQTLKEFEHRRIRVTYDDGRMEFMSPLPRHEVVKTAAARLIEAWADEYDLPLNGLGNVTVKSRKLMKGLEPDECYYVTTPMPDFGDDAFEVGKYPPPDLATEVDVTATSVPRQPVYGALGVPEIWRWDGLKITPLHRQPDGKYREMQSSLAFPDLPMEKFNEFLKIALTADQRTAVKAFRQWMRQR